VAVPSVDAKTRRPPDVPPGPSVTRGQATRQPGGRPSANRGQATRKRWPYYIRWHPRPHEMLVYSKAIPRSVHGSQGQRQAGHPQGMALEAFTEARASARQATRKGWP